MLLYRLGRIPSFTSVALQTLIAHTFRTFQLGGHLLDLSWFLDRLDGLFRVLRRPYAHKDDIVILLGPQRSSMLDARPRGDERVYLQLRFRGLPRGE